MSKKFSTLLTTILLTLCLASSCMAKDLENIKFGDFLPDFDKTVNTFIVSKVTNKYAYDTRVKTDGEEVLGSKTKLIEFNFYNDHLFLIDITFADTSMNNYIAVEKALSKKYGKPVRNFLNGADSKMGFSSWKHKGNQYNLGYYQNANTKQEELGLTITSEFVTPGSDCIVRYDKKQEVKTLDDLIIFK